jgi:hypothetical protein
MNHGLVDFGVFHKRYAPIKYQFFHRFFWFKIDLGSPEKWPSKLVSYNKFNLYSFFDKDHIKLGAKTARDNYIKFAFDNGVNAEIKEVVIYTQLRFLGYVFNPVSFIFLKDITGMEYAIIEIGNTFNELKPYFVGREHFKNQNISFQTKKLFYISPFIELDNDLQFDIIRKQNRLNILIKDFNSEKILDVNFSGVEISPNEKSLLKLTLLMPFVTFRIIFLIHWHALKLWIRGVKYFKKDDNKELQKGNMTWKV